MAEYQLDVSQYRCPVPILMVKQALNQLQTGDILNVTHNTESTKQDFQRLCEHLHCALIHQANHQCQIIKGDK